jgi:hypothetical protein
LCFYGSMCCCTYAARVLCVLNCVNVSLREVHLPAILSQKRAGAAILSGGGMKREGQLSSLRRGQGFGVRYTIPGAWGPVVMGWEGSRNLHCCCGSHWEIPLSLNVAVSALCRVTTEWLWRSRLRFDERL